MLKTEPDEDYDDKPRKHNPVVLDQDQASLMPSPRFNTNQTQESSFYTNATLQNEI